MGRTPARAALPARFNETIVEFVGGRFAEDDRQREARRLAKLRRKVEVASVADHENRKVLFAREAKRLAKLERETEANKAAAIQRQQRISAKLAASEQREMLDMHVFGAFSSGKSLTEVARNLSVSVRQARSYAASTFERLRRKWRLPAEVMDDLFYPRRSGEPVSPGRRASYSAGATSVPAFLQLREWELVAESVEWAVEQMRDDGLRDLEALISREKLPEELYPPRFHSGADYDTLLWSDRTGMYLDDPMTGSFNKIVVSPVRLRNDTVLEARGVVGHERVIIRTYEAQCPQFARKLEELRERSVCTVEVRQTEEIVLKLAEDAPSETSSVVYHKQGLVWLSSDVELARWRAALKQFKVAGIKRANMRLELSWPFGPDDLSINVQPLLAYSSAK